MKGAKLLVKLLVTSTCFGAALPASAWQYWSEPIEVEIVNDDATTTKAYLWTYLAGATKSGHQELIDGMAYVTSSPDRNHSGGNRGEPVSSIHLIVRAGRIRADGSDTLKEIANLKQNNVSLVEHLQPGSFCNRNEVCGWIARSVCVSSEFEVQGKSYPTAERCWFNTTGKPTK